MISNLETIKNTVLIPPSDSCYTKATLSFQIQKQKARKANGQRTPLPHRPTDSTYPFISYLTDLLAKSKPSDAAVKKLHDLIDQIAAATGHDSTDIFRVLLAKLIEKPEEQQTFDKLLEMAEKIVAKH